MIALGGGLHGDARGVASGVIWIALVAISLTVLVGGKALLGAEVQKSAEACAQLGLVLDASTGQCGGGGQTAAAPASGRGVAVRVAAVGGGSGAGTLAPVVSGGAGSDALAGDARADRLTGEDADGQARDARAEALANRQARRDARDAEDALREQLRRERQARDEASPIRSASDADLEALAQRGGPAGIEAANEQLRRGQERLRQMFPPVVENTAVHGVLDGLTQLVAAPIEGAVDALLHPRDTLEGVLDVFRVPDVVAQEAAEGLVDAAQQCVAACSAGNGFDCGSCGAQAVATVASAGVGLAAGVSRGAALLRGKPKAPHHAPSDALAHADDAQGPHCEGGFCTPGSGNCFAAGTPVLTPQGLRPIEALRVGDLVLSRSERTGQLAPKPVAQTFVTHGQALLALTLRDPSGLAETLRVTSGHPFFVDGLGWLDSDRLSPGLRVRRADGALADVLSLVPLDSTATVFNFEVQDFHTYFVGSQSVWVHNTSTCPAPGERLGSGSFSTAYRDGDEVVKRTNVRVGREPEVYDLQAGDREKYVELVVDTVGDLRAGRRYDADVGDYVSFEDVVPEMRADNGIDIRMRYVDGHTLDDLSGDARDRAIRAMEETIGSANRALGERYFGEPLVPGETLEIDGWRVGVDDQAANFRFDSDGRLVGWIDPIMAWPPRSRLVAPTATE